MSKVVGRRYGMLVVVGAMSNRRFLCRCDCGRETVAWHSALAKGIKKDCGCVWKKSKDITGQKFGRLLALRPVIPGMMATWICRCECGGEGQYQRCHLLSGNTRSCGCLQRDASRESGKKNILDIAGQRFGRLVAVSPSTVLGGKRWICRCDCGKEVLIRSSGLIQGSTKSCGCLMKETSRARWYNPALSESDRETNRKRRADPRNVKWRNEVFLRDHYRCQVCGVTGAMVAHHKNAWASYPEMRFNINNGTTSCLGCHSDFHSIYGKGKNTKEQWDEFVNSRSGLGPNIYINRDTIVDVGERYGRLTIIERSGSRNGYSCWLCRCDCGKMYVTNASRLKHGRVSSCGCFRAEQIREHHRKKKMVKEEGLRVGRKNNL